jgi:uncharacterized protein YqfA (UPF0365 family)
MVVVMAAIVVMMMMVVVMVAAFAMRVRVIMAVIVGMAVRMIVMRAFRRIGGFDARLAFAATANSAHQSTSSSLIRNSSPPVTCT